MKLFFLLLFSLFYWEAQGASCCVANTSVPNLMILPAKWQQTFTVANSRVIGDVSPKGSSTFRDKNNVEQTNMARMDLAYSWTEQYQNGVSFKYQNKKRTFDGEGNNDSGWSDVGLFQAYQPIKFQRTWIFNTVNIPTSKSLYDSQEVNSVDAHGSGTYQAGLGVFHIENFMTWDIVVSSEVHHSFARTFEQGDTTNEVGSFWGGSVSIGAGYIPLKKKIRIGANLTPRMEGEKKMYVNGSELPSKKSLVWDSVLNMTYTINANYAVGASYLDQTIFGPARNSALNRTISVLLQTHFL